MSATGERLIFYVFFFAEGWVRSDPESFSPLSRRQTPAARLQLLNSTAPRHTCSLGVQRACSDPSPPSRVVYRSHPSHHRKKKNKIALASPVPLVKNARGLFYRPRRVFFCLPLVGADRGALVGDRGEGHGGGDAGHLCCVSRVEKAWRGVCERCRREDRGRESSIGIASHTFDGFANFSSLQLGWISANQSA